VVPPRRLGRDNGQHARIMMVIIVITALLARCTSDNVEVVDPQTLHLNGESSKQSGTAFEPMVL